ncbi:MAG: phosphatase PAP2 family protein [Rhizomicrobium sp.]
MSFDDPEAIMAMTRALGAALLLLFCLGPASARLLAPGALNPALLLPPPPASGSTDAKAEVAELHAIARRATPAMLAAARRDSGDESADIFNAVLGFDITALPVTDRLLNEVREEQGAEAGSAKNFFHRARPWIVDPSIAICGVAGPGAAHTSYPSGHATLAYSLGVVLAALDPRKAQAILARASNYAENRLVCGMHFRSDIVAGEVLGTVVASRLMQVPSFETEMGQARAELAAHHRD